MLLHHNGHHEPLVATASSRRPKGDDLRDTRPLSPIGPLPLLRVDLLLRLPPPQDGSANGFQMAAWQLALAAWPVPDHAPFGTSAPCKDPSSPKQQGDRPIPRRLALAPTTDHQMPHRQRRAVK